MKHSFLVVVFLILSVSNIAQGQEIVKSFSASTVSGQELNNLKLHYGINKIIPSLYETQILIALSYFPELKNISIELRLKKTKAPLSSKPTLPGLIQSAKKRKYIITISEETNSELEPILFKKLNFNAQVGVLGHELSHVSDYLTKGFGKIMNLLLIEIFSKKQVDKFESGTDHICINHGLGFQLLEWSKSVRENLKIDYWRGADNLKHKTSDERYLNPETIIQIIKQNQLYHRTLNQTPTSVE